MDTNKTNYKDFNVITSVIQALDKYDTEYSEGCSPIFDFNDEENRSSYFAELIRESGNLNSSNTLGITALMAASASGFIDIVRLLINAGADVNRQDCEGYSALMFAISINNFDLVKLLINSGSDIFQSTIGGYNSLLFAVYSVNSEICRFILEVAQKQDKEKKLEKVLVCIDDGPSEQIFVISDTKIRVNSALLHLLSTRSPVVALDKQEEFLDLFISDSGFNIQNNKEGGIGDLMLEHATMHGYEKIINKLIELGVELKSNA